MQDEQGTYGAAAVQVIWDGAGLRGGSKARSAVFVEVAAGGAVGQKGQLNEVEEQDALMVGAPYLRVAQTIEGG